jgi:GTP pyrophosphokinase
MPNGIDVVQGMPLPAGEWRYSSRFIEALRVAATIHADGVRKQTTIPYVSHLLATCAIAMEHGANEDEAIAALLHDAIEDVRPVTAVRATIGWFGAEVLRIVEGCTDADSDPKPPWRPRKEAYLAHLALADRSILLISASDKLHNARAVVADLRTIGDQLWGRFTGSRDGTLWYYRALVDAYRRNPAHVPALIDELERTVTEMERLASASSSEVMPDRG